jgi:TolA-binding protein
MKQWRAVRWGVAGAILLLTGCAYFNTLYNAKAKYNEAEKAESQRRAAEALQGQDVQTAIASPNARTYEEVIEKCKKMIGRYPDSKHVDDAMLLIGKSLYALGRYEEAVSALDSLETRYPKTNLLAETRFLKGKSLVGAKHYDTAVTVLTAFVDDFRGSDQRPEAFYLMCISQMQMGLPENAVASLQRLEKDHGRSEYRFKAQVDAAKILAEKKMYQESLRVYQRLTESRIPEKMRWDVFIGMARVQEEVGDHAGTLATLDELKGIPVTVDREPVALLLRGRANAGADSTDKAIRIYRDVATRFARGTYGAEANYRLGIIYESIDSLVAAQRYYQEVPKAFSSSEYAEESIKRAGDIGRVLRLQEVSGDDSPEAVALRTFSMAEIQFFQFNNADKAIPSYEKIVIDFPDSEFAPRSAYALGYIYGVVKADSVKAREYYDVLRTRYPDTQQAQLAYAFYRGAAPPPPLPDLIEQARRKSAPPAEDPAQSRPVPGAAEAPPPVIPAPGGAPADSARAPEGGGAPPDTTTTAPAPADTTAAPADSTGGD